MWQRFEEIYKRTENPRVGGSNPPPGIGNTKF